MKMMLLGDRDAPMRLIQPIDARDADALREEYDLICRMTDCAAFSLLGVEVDDWNRDLSPWPAPSPFHGSRFDGEAAHTLDYIRRECSDGGACVIGGYSLSGLFALWACCVCDGFRGCAAASPSVWYPGWIDFAKKHPVSADCVYLSLGDREEKTRNRSMASVGDCVREMDALLDARPSIAHTLEWNPGNHFNDPALRTAKAFAWCVHHLLSNNTKGRG